MKQTSSPDFHSLIHLCRGHRIILDFDIANLYGVTTKALIQAVSRNAARFPKDFVFTLSDQEVTILRSQIVTSRLEPPGFIENSNSQSRSVRSRAHGGARRNPYAFTEQGIAMLSSVLHSPRAIEVNIAIMRTFVEIRSLAFHHKELEEKIQILEEKCDAKFKVIFDTRKEIIRPSVPTKRPIGFRGDRNV